MNVTKTTRNGKFVYTVGGLERTSSKDYAYAVAGRDNPYHSSGLWMRLTNSYTEATKTAMTEHGTITTF